VADALRSLEQFLEQSRLRPHSMTLDIEELRFTVGDRVECRVEIDAGHYDWRSGTVVSLMYSDSTMEQGKIAPYQVKLDENSIPGRSYIWAPTDDDRCIRVIIEDLNADLVFDTLPDEPFIATKRGEAKKVVKWLRKGNNVDARRPDGDTLLHTAVMNKQPDLVRILVNQGATIDVPNRDGGTPLMIASQIGECREVDLLLQLSADVNRQSPHGATALMTAAAHEQPEAITLLLEAAAIVDLQTLSGYSALMSSAAAGADQCVEVLLDAGACTELKNNMGHTALKCAELKGRASTQQILLQHELSKLSELSKTPDASPIKATGGREVSACKAEDRRRSKRSLHRASGLLARAMRDSD